MEIKNLRDNRSNDLIANFIDGYAHGWRFAVRECFRDALDIKLTPRVGSKIDSKGKKTVESIWTQGKEFNFGQGYILYDTRLAYEITWGEALKHIKLSIQINEITPSKTVIFKLYRPLKDFSGIEEVEIIQCNQKEFVVFLKTGMLNSRDLFKEYKWE